MSSLFTRFPHLSPKYFKLNIFQMLLIGGLLVVAVGSVMATLPLTRHALASGISLLNSSGEVTISDVDSAGYSFQSDRLAIGLEGLSDPPTDRETKAYLLDSLLQASICTAPLTVTDGALNTRYDFPGQNLSQFDTFRLMQESEVYSATLPAEPLTHLGLVLVSADDTPQMVGYGIGLRNQAKLLAAHAGFAIGSLNGTPAGQAAAKRHAEHVLNILYGESHPSFGDQDGDGFPENPGDTYGILAYRTKMQETLQQVVDSADATAAMRDRIADVNLALDNIGDGVKDGENDEEWAALLIEKGLALIAATDDVSLSTAATQMQATAERIYKGGVSDDDGEVEPSQGGAQTAFQYTQLAAAFPGPNSGDSIYLTNSNANSTSDQLTLKLTGLAEPKAGESYWAYLLRNDGTKLVLGMVDGTGGAIEMSIGITGANLARDQHGFQLTVGQPVAEDMLPSEPLPYIRNALASATDTPSQKGYGAGLAKEANLLAAHAQFALDEMNKPTPNLIGAKVHTEHVLNILYGELDARYGDLDNNGFTENPGDGYGLLSYRTQFSQTMQLAADNAGERVNISERAADVQTALNNIGGGQLSSDWVGVLLEKANALLATNDSAEAQTLANQVRAAADRVYNGADGFNNGTDDGIIQPSEGGALSAYQSAQKALLFEPVSLITVTVTPTAMPSTTPPTGTPTDGTVSPTETPDPNATLTATPTVEPTVEPTAESTVTAAPTSDEAGADGYESNNTCQAARPIDPNGSVQRHNFHVAGDSDWVRFDAINGEKYLIEVNIPGDSLADVAMEIYGECGGVVDQSQDFSFSPSISLNLDAKQDGAYYMKFFSHDPDSAGEEVRYDLSVRALTDTASPGLVILVAGAIKPNDPVQPNIYNVTDNVYQLFINNGYTDDRIHYLAPDVGRENVDASASVTNLHAAITQWVPDNIGSDTSVTLYLMDHGAPELFYLDKRRGEWVTPDQLDEWLTELETAQPQVNVNAIIEACYSGSFITEPGSISKPGRVIITSADDENLAWASNQGAQFSDHFIAELGRGKSVYQAFNTAQIAAEIAHPSQIAWLDGDGDGNALDDGSQTIAARRGFTFQGTFDLPEEIWPPYIETVEPITVEGGNATIKTKIFDDVAVTSAFAVVYPPSYEAPAESEALVQEDRAVLRSVTLLDAGNGNFSALTDGFSEDGTYRVVIYAKDGQDLSARPVAVNVQVGAAGRLYLPITLQ